MSKIPKYIAESILISSKHDAIAKKHNKIIRDWIEKEGFDEDLFVDQLIDSIENGTDNGKDFIAFIENEIE